MKRGGQGGPPLPDNPYRRFFTKNRSFEELAARARQEQAGRQHKERKDDPNPDKR